VSVTPVPTEADATSPTELDFVYQTRVGDGIGVFVSVGGEMHRVDEAAPGTRHKHPLWTNDGSRVAFVVEGAWDATGSVVRSSEVWTVGPMGEDPHAVIRCDCWDLNNPSWSPNGSEIAFVEFDAPLSEGPPSASRIVVLDVASGTRAIVVESEPGQLVDIPRWSPDGRSLVVSIDRFDSPGNETGSSFAVVPANGGPMRPILPFEEFGYDADWNRATGTLVFGVQTQEYASPDPKVSAWDLFEIQPDGTGRRAITDVGAEQRLSLPMWSADGSQIAATLDATVGEPGGQMPVIVDPATGAIAPLGPPLGDYARLRPPRTGTTALDDEAWFASNWDSNGIRLTRRDGSASREILTDLPARVILWNPDWSPGGDQLVVNFVSDVDPGAILISDLDGGRQQVIACEALCLGFGAASWSRDGKRIAYAEADESATKIRVFDVESGSTVDVLEMNEPGRDVDPVRWSPTGDELVGILHRWNAEDDTKLDSAAVVVVSIADGSVREITDASGFASYPDWHPTQDLVVFSSYGISDFQRLDEHASNLFTIRSDGSDLRQITNFPAGGQRASQPTWSPEGDLIVFTLVSGSNDEIRHIATIAPDGTNLTDLGAPGTHNRLRPTP
jgi:Tol biopolymer transport system component